MTSTYTPQVGSLADRVCAYFLAYPSDELDPFQIVTKFGVSNVYNVKAQLAKAVDAQLLVIAHNSEDEAVYGPGIKIDGLKSPAPAPAPVVPTGKHIPAKRGQQRPTLDDYSTQYQPPVPAAAPQDETVSQNSPPVSSTVECVSSIPEVVSSIPEVVSSTAEGVFSTTDTSLDDFVIEDDVPLPPAHCTGGRTAKLYALLAKLKPLQSTPLPMRDHAILVHSQAKAHKNKLGVFTIRTNPKTEMLRVWRVS